MRRHRFALLSMAWLALAGCAGQPETGDSAAADAPQRCDFDETWSCVKRLGHAERCFCADKDTLRELLEPTVR